MTQTPAARLDFETFLAQRGIAYTAYDQMRVDVRQYLRETWELEQGIVAPAQTDRPPALQPARVQQPFNVSPLVGPVCLALCLVVLLVTVTRPRPAPRET